MVLDIRMPGISGIDVLRNLRASDPEPAGRHDHGLSLDRGRLSEAMKYGAAQPVRQAAGYRRAGPGDPGFDRAGQSRTVGPGHRQRDH
ncbi:MAG: hypothetical protein M0C28_23520 [Candidatus Moduliflexus flocculans]|nr:hypothetical protein [Candidatus Moduliflexus flocculans]